MAGSASKTRDEYFAHLGALSDARRYQEALHFSAAAIGEVHPELSYGDLTRLHGMMEIAANIVEIEEQAEQEPDRATA